jgi:hypothetical protein
MSAVPEAETQRFATLLAELWLKVKTSRRREVSKLGQRE